MARSTHSCRRAHGKSSYDAKQLAWSTCCLDIIIPRVCCMKQQAKSTSCIIVIMSVLYEAAEGGKLWGAGRLWKYAQGLNRSKTAHIYTHAYSEHLHGSSKSMQQAVHTWAHMHMLKATRARTSMRTHSQKRASTHTHKYVSCVLVCQAGKSCNLHLLS